MRGENCEPTYVIVGAILKRPTIKYYTRPNNVFLCSFVYDFVTGKPNRSFTVINILKVSLKLLIIIVYLDLDQKEPQYRYTTALRYKHKIKFTEGVFSLCI